MTVPEIGFAAGQKSGQCVTESFAGRPGIDCGCRKRVVWAVVVTVAGHAW